MSRTSHAPSVPKGEKALELEVLIEDREPFSRFEPYFKTRRDAVIFFGNAHAKRNVMPAAVKRPCMICGSSPASRLVMYRWNAQFFKNVKFGGLDAVLLLLGHLRVRINSDVISFNTFHPSCDACGRSLRSKRLASVILNVIGWVLVFFGGTGTGAFLPLAIITHDNDRGGMFAGAATFAGALACGILCVFVASRLRIPQPVRYLATPPFFSRSAKFVAGA